MEMTCLLLLYIFEHFIINFRQTDRQVVGGASRRCECGEDLPFVYKRIASCIITQWFQNYNLPLNSFINQFIFLYYYFRYVIPLKFTFMNAATEQNADVSGKIIS